MSRLWIPLRLLVCVAIAALVWLPSLHRWMRPPSGLRAALAEKSIARWRDEAVMPSAAEMRTVNPEWDFMARTYTVLALDSRPSATYRDADPAPSALAHLIDTTLEQERRHGQRYFLLPYADQSAFVHEEGRSLFVDGEILLMMATRRGDPRSRERWQAESDERAAAIVRALEASPTLSGESYPNECWTFCNTTALLALQRHDRARGTSEHAELIGRWLAFARQHLVDPANGLLIASYTRDGRVLQGPEGSSAWMNIHNLAELDPQFAAEQYAIAKRELATSVFGFGWSREWPRHTRGFGAERAVDVDSGGVVPLLEASAGASGLALLAASAMDDQPYFRALLASLQLGAVPRSDGSGYRASNEVGEAVLSYALERSAKGVAR